MAGPRLYYIRHGQTDWNAEQRYQGRMDIPLNDTGRAQARQNGKTLSEILSHTDELIFVSSPLVRARETMEIIRQELGLDPKNYELAERLIEISYGDFEGITQAEIKAVDRELYYERKRNMWTFRPNNGESHKDVVTRVRQWHADLDENASYVVTAHGAIGRVIRHLLAGLDTEQVEKFAFPQDKVFLFEDGKETQF